MNIGLILLLLLVVVAVVVYLQQKKKREAEAVDHRMADPVRREKAGTVSGGIDVRDISPGAVVAFEGKDWLVRGTLTMREDGYVWKEHLLDDATTKRWLSVEDDEELEIALWEAVKGAALEPGPATVEHDGIRYRLDEHGTAAYTALGTTGTPENGSVEYWDYEAGDRLLGFERYSGQTWEVAVGRTLDERGVDVYPSSAT